MTTATPKENWWDKYPPPVAQVESYEPSQLQAWMLDEEMIPGRGYLVVDVRMADFEGLYIKDALNLHAQSFHDDLDSIGPKLAKAKVVLFYCSKSNGRGPRSARWYQDWLNSHSITTSKAGILAGGIAEWTRLYGEDKRLVAEVANVKL